MMELRSHRMKDGTVLSVFKEGEEKYSVSQFDKGDVEMWYSEFDNATDAWTEFYKRVESDL